MKKLLVVLLMLSVVSSTEMFAAYNKRSSNKDVVVKKESQTRVVKQDRKEVLYDENGNEVTDYEDEYENDCRSCNRNRGCSTCGDKRETVSRRRVVRN